jgi:hypothetical protein
MAPKQPSTEHLLLLLASVTLLGVLLITALQTIMAGYSLDAHLRENMYGIVFAAIVTLVCVLEMVGWNWDRGYLDRIIDLLNRAMGRRTEEAEDLEENLVDEKLGIV